MPMNRNVGQHAPPLRPASSHLRPAQEEAFDGLLLSMLARKRLLILTGGDGQERAAVFHMLTDHVGSDGSLVLSAAAWPGAEVEDLIAAAARNDSDDDEFDALVARLESRLDLAGAGLLAVEDAHALAPRTLSDLRDLSFAETPGGRCLQVLLCGSPDLERLLSRPELAGAVRDVGVIYRLAPGARCSTAPAPEPSADDRDDAIDGEAPALAIPLLHTQARRMDPGPVPTSAIAARKGGKRRVAAGLLVMVGAFALSGLVVANVLRADGGQTLLESGWNTITVLVSSQLGSETRSTESRSTESRPSQDRPLEASPTQTPAPDTVPSRSENAPVATAARAPAAAMPPAPKAGASPVTAGPGPDPALTALMDPAAPIGAASDRTPSPLAFGTTAPSDAGAGSGGDADTGPPLEERAPLPEVPAAAARRADPAPAAADAGVAARVSRLAETARRQIASKHLTTPAGNNAFETALEIRDLHPGAPEAAALVTEIKGVYRRWASLAERDGKWDDARLFYRRALTVDPDDPEVQALLRAAEERLSGGGGPSPANPETALTTEGGALGLLRDPAALTAVLSSIGDPDRRLPDGKTLTMLAAEAGLTDAVTALLAAGARPNARSPDGASPVMYAAWYGHADAITALAAAGADLDARNLDGKTALMAAAARGNMGAVQTLLDHGAAVDTAATHGWTALMYAANAGHEPVARALVAHGADPYRSDERGNSAYTLGALQGHTEVVEALRRR